MAKPVPDVLWEMLERAGVKRRYGIVGDALNPVIQALDRNANIEFIHVRHEEDGVFAAVAETSLTSKPGVGMRHGRPERRPSDPARQPASKMSARLSNSISGRRAHRGGDGAPARVERFPRVATILLAAPHPTFRRRS